mmetsp:Transcript_27883/g.70497  ORF Transcript_27883/g.70497 Transcript_27883/m.70497 type:complete len:264 (+) Transcript_27883:1444-2235(+)
MIHDSSTPLLQVHDHSSEFPIRPGPPPRELEPLPLAADNRQSVIPARSVSTRFTSLISSFSKPNFSTNRSFVSVFASGKSQLLPIRANKGWYPSSWSAICALNISFFVISGRAHSSPSSCACSARSLDKEVCSACCAGVSSALQCHGRVSSPRGVGRMASIGSPSGSPANCDSIELCSSPSVMRRSRLLVRPCGARRDPFFMLRPRVEFFLREGPAPKKRSTRGNTVRAFSQTPNMTGFSRLSATSAVFFPTPRKSHGTGTWS